MILSCPDVHLICINDLSSLTVCLNLLISEHVLGLPMYVLPVVISAYTFFMCKIKGYLLTYLLTYLHLSEVLNFSSPLSGDAISSGVLVSKLIKIV